MKIAHIVFVPLLLLGSCAEDSDKVLDLRDSTSTEAVTSDDNKVKTPILKKSDWTYKVSMISEGNWGYQLFENGTMVINQTSIPAVQGTLGFETKEKAERTARFVLEKVNRGEFPPTVSREELESLNVLRSEN
jgi:hypothetical protein